ncbi:MAG: peptide chain release factor 2 [Patescibacteria group bacterium]
MRAKREELLKLETETQHEKFWEDRERAREVGEQISALKNEVTDWEDLSGDIGALAELDAMAGEEKDFSADIGDLERRFGKAQRAALLSGTYDKASAILSVIAGAGGDDAEDWARIMFRMYTRFAEQKGWTVTVLHLHKNEHDGIKNATFRVEGSFAYGLLRGEMGVHRLVRISPFSSKKLRHTSFAYLEVLPVLPKTADIEIRDDDLDISFARSSGPGGQNVNKRSTAVRIMHKPTGIQVHVDSERGQAANRDIALSILRAKLYTIREESRRKEIDGFKGETPTKIEWGSQIRSYVVHPYQMVKDHRTGAESSQVDAVLDGDLDLFIEHDLLR